MAEMEWLTESDLIVEGTPFVLAPTSPRFDHTGALPDSLLLRKPRWMVERYDRLRADMDAAANVVELGIYQGGSTALLALLLRPARLVAIELMPARVASLDTFIAAHNLQDCVRPHFGVDQANRSRVEEIVEDEFGSAPLDLVIDDASHLFQETRASFNTLFPRLRPGGRYIIEDWSWQHMRDEAVAQALMADAGARESLKRRLAADDIHKDIPLSVFILELVLTAGYAEEIVAEINSVRRGWTVIRRGTAALDSQTFNIANSYGSLGRSVLRGATNKPA